MQKFIGHHIFISSLQTPPEFLTYMFNFSVKVFTSVLWTPQIHVQIWIQFLPSNPHPFLLLIFWPCHARVFNSSHTLGRFTLTFVKFCSWKISDTLLFHPHCQVSDLNLHHLFLRSLKSFLWEVLSKSLSFIPYTILLLENSYKIELTILLLCWKISILLVISNTNPFLRVKAV